MAVLFVLGLIVFSTLIFALYRKSKNGICKSRKRLDGMTCLVTGGTSGIGLEISIDFAMRGARVIVACPFEEEGKNAEKKIIEISENNNVVFKILDLASFKSVRNFAADILKTEERLDILMNNAGVPCLNKKSEDGMDVAMQVSYLGHFLLTLLLMPILKKSGTPSSPSRIVNTSSMMQRLMARLDVENINAVNDGGWSKGVLYANAKLCLVLFARELNKRLMHSNVVINSVDPGAVWTGIFLKGGSNYLNYVLLFLCVLSSKTPFEGAQTALHVALDKKAGQTSGLFYEDCKISEPSKVALDDKLAKRLWEKSVELVNLGEDEVKELLQ